MTSLFRDPFSGLSHLIGALLAIIGTSFLLQRSIEEGDLLKMTSYSIFGLSMFLLYLASALYHLIKASPQILLTLQKIDHLMIYFLIAGTYTPFCLLAIKGTLGIVLLTIVWTLAFGGIFLSFYWIHAPRWFSTSIYLIMGWMIVWVIRPIMQTLPTGGLILLLAGGLSYSIGAVIYALKRPNLIPGYFGFHELWHLFVLGGTTCHFFSVFSYT